MTPLQTRALADESRAALLLNRRRGVRRRRIRWILTLLVSVLVADALIGDRGLLQLVRARQDAARLMGAITDLRWENRRLRADIQRLREDPHAIEALARRELGLARPGEVVFLVRPPSGVTPGALRR